MARISGLLAVLLATLALLAPPASARTFFPAELRLPDGFQPEGIAIGAWPTAYFGSLADGRIYQASLLTGRGRVLSAGPGTPSVGIKVDSVHGRLFVAGGTGGDARVIDARTGEVRASYRLAGEGGFVNDLVITREAVWFTDSYRPVLYKLPLGRHGELPAQREITTVPLSGDIEYVPGEINGNGIVTTPDREALLIGQTVTGQLFRVDPASGVTRTVDLDGESLPHNDGQLRSGRDLYVVRNRANTVTRLELNRAGTSARVVRHATDPRFDVPATMAAFGPRFYLVNARFGTPPTPQTSYRAVAIHRF
ncbi:NHL repeat-containing protein [Amycolatopsis aidingensis]|uniref:superoxide dismutase n=1 Tax=Amycolatopsis aidingensis TaxID=2842453 RepID=UPI001C0AF986|nr:superoxide dismutase [Amycolatopsis aidingensis]